jgi:zinc protease
MKKLFCSILFAIALVPAVLFAQMGEPYEMKINGVKVIVQPSGNEIVEVLTIIKGGVQNTPQLKQALKTWP